MAQRITRLYRLVTFPKIYSGFQTLLGAADGRERLFQEVIRATPSMNVLDVGCGPGSLFPYLPHVNYTGIDLNPNSIARARDLYGNRGRFLVGDVTNRLPDDISKFDLVIVSALLHHLGDDEARRLFAALTKLITPQGRIVTIDNVWLPKQNVIAKLINSLDSGLNVRTPEQYVDLTSDLSLHIETHIYRDLLRIPYDHFCMSLTRLDSSPNGTD